MTSPCYTNPVTVTRTASPAGPYKVGQKIRLTYAIANSTGGTWTLSGLTDNWNGILTTANPSNVSVSSVGVWFDLENNGNPTGPGQTSISLFTTGMSLSANGSFALDVVATAPGTLPASMLEVMIYYISNCPDGPYPNSQEFFSYPNGGIIVAPTPDIVVDGVGRSLAKAQQKSMALVASALQPRSCGLQRKAVWLLALLLLVLLVWMIGHQTSS